MIPANSFGGSLRTGPLVGLSKVQQPCTAGTISAANRDEKHLPNHSESRRMRGRSV